jgi:hypothetical protein
MKRSRRSSRRRTGRTTRSPNLSTLCKGELVAFVSELEAQKKLASQSAPDQISADAAAEPALHRVPKAPVPCLFVEEAVRSGQVIDFPGGDVVVIGAVGSGAEIVAGGSIHVYGTLRGRALAGAGGDRTARIFCRGFQAEPRSPECIASRRTSTKAYAVVPCRHASTAWRCRSCLSIEQAATAKPPITERGSRRLRRAPSPARRASASCGAKGRAAGGASVRSPPKLPKSLAEWTRARDLSSRRRWSGATGLSASL